MDIVKDGKNGRISFGGFDFMKRRGPQLHITENYVCSPPALTITDETGAVWALGMLDHGIHGGEFTFDVLRNGKITGEIANRIERRNGKISVFGPQGRKGWNGRSFL